MSQGSGSPVTFLDAETCDHILKDIRGGTASFPTSIVSRVTQGHPSSVGGGGGLRPSNSDLPHTDPGSINLCPDGPQRGLPWAYTYTQFNQLLQAYPKVHPEVFVTFGILQEQPRRGSCREWGEVAGVLSHMTGACQ